MSHTDIPVVSAAELAVIAAIVGDLYGKKTIEAVFKRHDFPESILSDPSLKIPNVQYLGFLEACSREAGEPLLGAIIGSRAQFAELGPYGRYVTSAPSLRLALERASKALKYHESGSRLNFELQESHLSITYHPPTPKALGSWHQCDGVAAMLINLVRLYEASEWVPQLIVLAAAHDKRKRRLEDFFETAITARREGTQIRGAIAHIPHGEMMVTRASAPLSRCELRQMVSDRPPMSFAETLRHLMTPIIREGLFDLEDIADRIGLGSRTVQRRLATEGQTFGRLLQDVRQTFAEELLLQTDMTTAELSLRLGYSSKQHFIRAFKSWRGMPPGEFRTTSRNRLRSSSQAALQTGSESVRLMPPNVALTNVQC